MTSVRVLLFIVLVTISVVVTADTTTTTTTTIQVTTATATTNKDGVNTGTIDMPQLIEDIIAPDTSATKAVCMTIDENGNMIPDDTNENCVFDVPNSMNIAHTNKNIPSNHRNDETVADDVEAVDENGANDDEYGHYDEEHDYTENDDSNDTYDEDGEEVEQEENLPLGSDIGIIQSLDDTYLQQIYDHIKVQQQYVHEQVQTHDQYKKVRKLCRNTHESCTYWALLGECDANPGYMKIHCGPACQTCEQLHVETRCPMNDLEPSVFDQKDDLNNFYERIINDPYYKSQYNVTVLSRPTAGDKKGLWVIQFDNMLNEEEAKHMIELGYKEGYERSADVGEEKEDGTFTNSVNEGRTSTNAWCMEGCMNDTVTNDIHERIENITLIPRINYENLQILQYTEQQYYNEHNDFIEYQVDRPCGSRILTFYFYLNTLPEDIGGGGTNFPKLDLTVTPKLGRAILWPSILNDDPYKIDLMSNHQALPVLNGHVKYGFNAWIHQRDFQTNNNIGCA